MFRRSAKRAAIALAATVAMLGVVLVVGGPTPASAAASTFISYDPVGCERSDVSISVSAGAGILTLAGVGFSNTYSVPGFCGAVDYHHGVYEEEEQAWPDPPIPTFTYPTYDGPQFEDVPGIGLVDREAQFDAYVDQLHYIEWQVKADLGAPSPGAVNWNLVETTAKRVVAALDAMNAAYQPLLPTSFEGTAFDRGFLTWLNGGNWGFGGSAELRAAPDGSPVALSGTWHPLYHNFNLASPELAGEGGAAFGEQVGVGAGCIGGTSVAVTGYGTAADLIGQTWRAGAVLTCGLLAGTNAGDGGLGGLFVAAGASYSARISG